MKTPLFSLGLVVLLAGCSSSPAEPLASPSAATSSSTTPSQSPSPSPTPSATSASPTKVPAPAPASFSQAITYADGLKVEVIKTKHSKLSDEGGEDGNLAIGAPLLIVSIRVTNGTGARLSLDDSDAVLTFAGKKSEADGVDDVTTDTLYGHLAVGKSKIGRYGFAEPKSRPDAATVKFTVDANHPAARFKGPLG